MAQTRYHNYERPLASFDENLRILSLAHFGRICGFDTMTPQGGTTLRLAHTATGFVGTTTGGAAMPARGVVQSRQGFLVHEDAVVDVTVDFNAANGSERIDLLVMSHSYIATPGGSAAIYSVIKGANATPFPSPGPSVSNVLTEVPIGRFIIPANAADHSATVYEPFNPKSIGGLPGMLKADELNLQDISSGYQKGDFNRLIRPGIFYINSTLNRPTVITAEWFVIVFARSGKVAQLASASGDGRTYVRSSPDSGVSWTPWVNLNNPDVEASITGLSTSIGNLQYTPNNYIADSDSLTVAAGKLDAALKVVADALAVEVTNINNLETQVGDLQYSSNLFIIDGDSITIALGKLDLEIGNRSQKIVTFRNPRPTASYQLLLSDKDTVVEMNVAGANNLTVPLNATVAFPIGSVIGVTQYGAGVTTIQPETGSVFIRSNAGALNLANRYSMAVLLKVGTNEWYLLGDIA